MEWSDTLWKILQQNCKTFKVVPTNFRTLCIKELQISLTNSVTFIKNRSSHHPEAFLGKCVLKIYRKCTGEYPWRSAISIKLLCSFIEMTLWHGCSLVNLLHIFRNLFIRTALGGCFCKNIFKEKTSLNCATNDW